MFYVAYCILLLTPHFSAVPILEQSSFNFVLSVCVLAEVLTFLAMHISQWYREFIDEEDFIESELKE